MATPKHLSVIDKITRKTGRNIGTLVKEAGIAVTREINHPSQLTDEQANEFIKIHGVFLMKAKKGKQ